MQTRNKILDDLSQLVTNAMGVAQGARGEAETAIKGAVERFLAERGLVTREEFDAVRAMAEKAREENDALAARVATLEGRGEAAAGAQTAPTPEPASPGVAPGEGRTESQSHGEWEGQ